jgi:hypothetical protein
MIPQEMTDSSPRLRSASFETIVKWATRLTMLVRTFGRDPPVACSRGEGGSKRAQTVLRDITMRRWDSANAELYHAVKWPSNLCYD